MVTQLDRRFGWLMVASGIINVLFWAAEPHHGRTPTWLDGATLILFGTGLIIAHRRPARQRRRAAHWQMACALVLVAVFVWTAVSLPIISSYALAIAAICYAGWEAVLYSRARSEGRAA